MIRTTAFAIILGTFGAPALAGDGASLKDTPAQFRDTFRHEAARLAFRRARCAQPEASRPLVCEATARLPGAPGRKLTAPGAR
jgi:hypothetical protein